MAGMKCVSLPDLFKGADFEVVSFRCSISRPGKSVTMPWLADCRKVFGSKVTIATFAGKYRECEKGTNLSSPSHTRKLTSVF